MTFRFLRMYSDATTNKAPSYWKVEAESRMEAIKKFCAEYGLKLVEVAGEPVWFEAGDNAMMRYLVDEGRDK